MRRWLPFLLLLLATTAFARVPAPAGLSPSTPPRHRLAKVEGRDPARYGYDDHATTRFPTAKHEATTDTYTYDAIGNSIAPTPTLGSQHLTGGRFCGERSDTALGLDHRRARHLNPNPGRYWTMDAYERNSTDPLSLHKYLYAHCDPVNGIDPSGHDTSFIGQLATQAGIFTLATLTVNSITTAVATKSITSHILNKGVIPDGIFLNFGGGGSARGFTAGVDAMIYYDFNSRSASLLISGEVGLAPVSIFKQQGGGGYLASVGLAFNANSPGDFSGLGFTATWPAVMGKTVLPKQFRGWYYFLTTLAARNSTGTQLSKRSGVIQFGYSPSSGAAYVSYGLYWNVFSATVGYTSEPIPLADIPDEIKMIIEEATTTRQNYNDGVTIPAG